MQPENFKPAKLSHEALDAFVEKYCTTKYDDAIPYTTKAGKTLPFSAVLTVGTVYADYEYRYLLGQTVPFHQTESPKEFPITQLAYIMNENGQPELWTRDSKLLMNFVLIGNRLGFVPLQKTDHGLVFKRYPGIRVVIHKEK